MTKLTPAQRIALAFVAAQEKERASGMELMAQKMGSPATLIMLQERGFLTTSGEACASRPQYTVRKLTPKGRDALRREI